MARFRLADLFGPPKNPDPEAELERQLRDLEHQAMDAVPGFGAQFLNRAGDLCIDAAKLDRGLNYLGRAIDMYLQAGRWDAAGAVCHKLLRVSPGAVRARCTLAWLSIGKGLGGDAQTDIRDYIQAARKAGPAHVEMTRKQLGLMAEAVFDVGVLQLVAEELWQLGDHAGAKTVGLRLKALTEGGSVSDHDQERTWAAVLRAALMGPRELAT